MLNWASKATAFQKKTYNYHKALFTYTFDTIPVVKGSWPSTVINSLSDFFPSMDAEIQKDESQFWSNLQENYDWYTYMGHGSPNSIQNGGSIYTLNTSSKEVKPRVIQMLSCNVLKYMDFVNVGYDPSIGNSLIFKTTNGGVTALGSSKITYSTADDYILQDYLGYGINVGEAFRLWLNQMVDSPLKFADRNDRSNMFNVLYGKSLVGDPFVKFKFTSTLSPIDKMPGNFTLYATKNLTMDSSITCYNYNTYPYKRCNIGSLGDINIEHASSVDTVYTTGNVTVTGKTTIKNTYIYDRYYNAKPTFAKSVTYNLLAYRDNRRFKGYDEANRTLDNYDVSSCSNVTIKSGVTRTLYNGKCYKTLTMESGSTVIFKPGDIKIGTINAKDGSYWRVSDPGKRTDIHVNGNLTWNATFSDPSNPNAGTVVRGLRWNVHKANAAISIGTRWYGELLAPNSDVTIGEKTKKFSGACIARNIHVLNKTVIHGMRFAPTDDLEKKSTVVADADNMDNSVESSPAFTPAGAQLTTFNRNTIGFNANEAGDYKVLVMSINGKIVASFNTKAMAGDNSINWNSESVARGRYIVTIKHGSFNNSTNVMLR